MVTANEVNDAIASVKPLSAALATARQEAGEGALVVAWLSDLHLHARSDYKDISLSFYASQVDASANLQLALTEVGALAPAADLLILGGDLADYGFHKEAPAGEYEELKSILDAHLPAGLPTLPLLGNHDHVYALSADQNQVLARLRRPDWPLPAEDDDYYYETHHSGWRFIALDSRQTGLLSDRQREWLRERLSKADNTPAIVLVHRPFVSVGNWVDHCRLEDRRTFDIIDQAPQVRAILSGHTHKTAGWQYRRKIHVVFPSTAYGIGDTCGWGCLVLSKQNVHSVFIKELAADTFESVQRSSQQREGNFRKLPTPLFESSELCDPCTLPQRPDPAARD